MARVLNNRTLLKELMLSLDKNGHPGYKLPMVGTLRSTLQDLWAYEAVVDEWPDYKAVILRPQQEQTHRFDFKHKNIYCYGDNVDAFTKLANQPSVIPWHKRLFFHAIPLHLIESLDEAAKKNGGKMENRHGENFYTISMEHKAMKQTLEKFQKMLPLSKLPAGFTVGKLKPEHAEFILQNWTYAKYYFASDDVEERRSWVNELRQIIGACITSAVYNSKGEAVSWQVIRLDGDSGLANTLPDYQRLGLYAFVGSYLVKQAYDMGHDNFGYATTSNSTQQYITMEKFGFSKVIRLDGDSGFANTLPDYQRQGLYAFVGTYLIKQSYDLGHDNFGYATTSNITPQYITMEKFGFSKVAEISHRFYGGGLANL